MAEPGDEFQDFQSDEDATLPFSLIRRILAERTGVTEEEVDDVFDAIGEFLDGNLMQHKEAGIPGLGMLIPACSLNGDKDVVFTPDPALEEKIGRRFALHGDVWNDWLKYRSEDEMYEFWKQHQSDDDAQGDPS